MLSTNKKTLISGCGFSWSGQERITWVKILKLLSNSIVDVGGPAVSNQFIINNTVEELFKNNYEYVVVQLTSVGKLDVEIKTELQHSELVVKDSIRNFTYNNIWPSSMSADHISKKLYYDWLYSPGLEINSLWKDLILLSNYCKIKNCKLIVFQGYKIKWTDYQIESLSSVMNTDRVLYDDYTGSEYYSYHDYTDKNTVPCKEYQVMLAEEIANLISIKEISKINKIKSQIYGNLSK